MRPRYLDRIAVLPTPATLLPGPEGLAWLLYESPTFRLVFDERQGMARAEEIVALLWPDTTAHAPNFDLWGQSPIAYVTGLLTEESESWDGTITRENETFCAFRPCGERPKWLPYWPDEEERP